MIKISFAALAVVVALTASQIVTTAFENITNVLTVTRNITK